jgi:hypothetical protein
MHFAPREHDVEGGGINVGDIAAGDFLANGRQRLHERRATPADHDPVPHLQHEIRLRFHD